MSDARSALVLGANGFIGSQLARHLVNQRWRVARVVRTIDNFPSKPDASTTYAIGEDAGTLTDALTIVRPTVVFNLAASGVGIKVTDTELERGNAGLVERLWHSVDPNVTRTIVHAGSWSQYEIPDTETDIDETMPMLPPTPYGAAKVRAEHVGHELSEDLGIGFVSLRLFNVYGPGEGSHRLIPHVAGSLSGGRVAPLTSGNQIRDFVHVDDVIRAFEAAGLSASLHFSAYNIATGVGTSVRDVATRVARELDADESLLGFGDVEQRRNEPRRVVGNSDSFRRDTGWAPSITISDGIRDTVDWVTRKTDTP